MFARTGLTCEVLFFYKCLGSLKVWNKKYLHLNKWSSIYFNNEVTCAKRNVFYHLLMLLSVLYSTLFRKMTLQLSSNCKNKMSLLRLWMTVVFGLVEVVDVCVAGSSVSWGCVSFSWLHFSLRQFVSSGLFSCCSCSTLYFNSLIVKREIETFLKLSMKLLWDSLSPGEGRRKRSAGANEEWRWWTINPDVTK